MKPTAQPEVWLRGPLPDLSPYLQPVAHALLQAGEEIAVLMQDFPEHLLWHRVAGLASPGFHIQHITGVLQRLFAYAHGRSLTPEEFAYLKAEGSADGDNDTKESLMAALQAQVETSLTAMRQLPEEELTKERSVGRSGLPSTVLGLLVHAAEHTMRHTGQLLVTVAVLKEKEKSGA